MKQIFIALLLFVCTGTTFAQFPGAGGGQLAGRQMQAPPSIGTVTGKLMDSAGRPVAGASILVMGMRMDTVAKKLKSVLLKSGASRANGSFSFDELPIAGPLTLKISASGYKSQEKTFSIMEMPKPGAAGNMPPPSAAGTQAGPPMNMGSMDMSRDLGKIDMKIEATELQGIVVTATRPGVKMDIDKKVFNVEKNLVSAGGTAVDIMKNVPSVNVDIDGNVTLRNATPQVYVDGRPSTLNLDQIPADAIESVEVITNPSAKYDASGGNAGILNIVLKKNRKSGYNGNINVGVDKRGGINGGASFNLRQGKFNFSANAFMNQMKNRNTGETHFSDLLSNPNMLVDQYTKGRNAGGFVFGKIGMDYFATERSTFSVGLIRVHGSMKPTETLIADSSFSDGTYRSYSERQTETDRTFNALGFQGGYKYLFPRKGEEITADINVFSGKMHSDANYNTSVYPIKGGSSVEEILQRIQGNGSNKFVTIQTDYVLPMGKSGKLETGLRAQLRTMTNYQANYFYDGSSGNYVQVPGSSVNYKNKDNVYAAYASYASSVKNFGYKLGLRAERSDYEAALTDTKQTFSNTYPLSLFPSLFLSQKLNKEQELQFSVTRRVNRPFFMQLIPFIDSSNQLNWTKGNAGLKPEFTYSTEASYQKKFKGNNSILGSIYYKHTTDLITSVLDTLTLSNGSTHPVSTYINANSSYMAGLEVTSQNQLTKWLDLNTNLNIYNSKINAENAGINSEALWSWFAKFNANFKLPATVNIQFSGTYQSKTNTPVNNFGGGGPGGGGPPMGGSRTTAQGYIKANYGFDLAVKKSFLKDNAASVTFAINDILHTRVMSTYTNSALFEQTSTRWPDTPMYRLTFTYRFGKMDMSMFKRKNMRAEGEGMQGAMQMQ